jgi:hypothetical protein
MKKMKPIFLSRARTSDFGLGLCHKQDHEDLVERLAGVGGMGQGSEDLQCVRWSAHLRSS